MLNRYDDFVYDQTVDRNALRQSIELSFDANYWQEEMKFSSEDRLFELRTDSQKDAEVFFTDR